MRNIKQIDKEINDVKNEIANVRGSTTEVYARIVGYYRSVRNWNKGKREEYGKRVMFSQENDRIKESFDKGDFIQETASAMQPCSGNVSYADLYVKENCPNCPPVCEYCKALNLKINTISVDDPDGFKNASEHYVRSAPSVIFYDENGQELSRAYSVKDIQTVMGIAESVNF